MIPAGRELLNYFCKEKKVNISGLAEVKISDLSEAFGPRRAHAHALLCTYILSEAMKGAIYGPLYN